MAAPAIVFGAVSAAAGVISALKTIFDDAHEKLDEKLNAILTQLQGLRRELVEAAAEVLEAIDGIRRQIDEDVALDNMSLADRALFSDLAVFNNKEEALGNSFQAADRLFREDDAVFAGPFMYVVNIRLAVLKDFDRNYFFNQQFQREFGRYIDHLKEWITQINDLITRSHIVVEAEEVEELNSKGILLGRHLEAFYIHNGAIVQTFRGRRNDLSEETARRLNRTANTARSAAIEADRQQSGVVEMEKTAAAWVQAFVINLRLALVSQLLDRPTMAIDFSPDGLMVDGRILPADLDLRSTLIELLTSREFRNRAQGYIGTFLEGSNESLVKFVYRQLFDHDATHDEIDLLHRVASSYGYAALIAALLHSEEYEKRYGHGLPREGQPVVSALKSLSE